MHRRSGRAALAAALLVAVACSGGSGGGPTPPPPPPEGNLVELWGDPGDPLAGGTSFRYTPLDAVIQVWVAGRQVEVGVSGDESWLGTFDVPGPAERLAKGTFSDLHRFDPGAAEAGGLGGFFGHGVGCDQVSGSFTIDDVTYDGDAVTSLDLRFEQRCDQHTEALHGHVRWLASDKRQSPGPVSPPPATLWRAPAGALPASGNYLYLESPSGELLGRGETRLHTPADVPFAAAGFRVRDTGISFLAGDWFGTLQPMIGRATAPGYYPGLRPILTHNPARGGFEFWRSGLFCQDARGWVAIDRLEWTDDVLSAVELRFEERCAEGAPALHGQYRWRADAAYGPGPVDPPPEGLWAPAPGTEPVAAGSWALVESEAGDPVGGGRRYVYGDGSFVDALAWDGHLQLLVDDGVDGWVGRLATMYGHRLVERGYYGGLYNYGMHDPVKGGFRWIGLLGDPLAYLTSWVVVDEVAYDDQGLAALDLRFEQRSGEAPPLHGKVHWLRPPIPPPGPSAAPPGLWAPSPGTVPAQGSFVRLESQPLDYVGQGIVATYTPATATVRVWSNFRGQIDVQVLGDQTWSGTFQLPDALDRIVPGFYGLAGWYPAQDPLRGGLDWSGEGRLCESDDAWMMIDAVTYDGDTLTGLDLRFERRCSGSPRALRGAVHYEAAAP